MGLRYSEQAGITCEPIRLCDEPFRGELSAHYVLSALQVEPPTAEFPSARITCKALMPTCVGTALVVQIDNLDDEHRIRPRWHSRDTPESSSLYAVDSTDNEYHYPVASKVPGEIPPGGTAYGIFLFGANVLRNEALDVHLSGVKLSADPERKSLSFSCRAGATDLASKELDQAMESLESDAAVFLTECREYASGLEARADALTEELAELKAKNEGIREELREQALDRGEDIEEESESVPSRRARPGLKRKLHHASIERKNQDAIVTPVLIGALVAAVYGGIQFEGFGAALWSFLGAFVVQTAIITTSRAGAYWYCWIAAAIYAAIGFTLGAALHPVLGIMIGIGGFYGVFVKLRSSIAYMHAEIEITSDEYE